MRAELVMIGTELLLGETVDTNATFIAQGLASIGIDVYYKSTVGDNWLRMTETLSQALSRADLVITSGGLGPTMDDLTRECVASVLNQPLALDPQALATIEEFFRKVNRTMTDNNRKQAYLPSQSQPIPNRWGTAPGIIGQAFGKTIISLPGVPRELKGMFTHSVLPYLTEHTEANKLVSRILHFVGIGESQLEERVKPILLAQTNPTIAPYASFGEVKLRIAAKSSSENQAMDLIKPVEEQILALTSEWCYGFDDDTLEIVVGRMLATKQETLAIAESCSGGLISNRITNVAGSSTYFERGYITYSNQAKMDLLHVPSELLSKHGAVSEQVAMAMAEGARTMARTNWGLSVTGIAGPDGGTIEKPVGLVYMAVAANNHTKVEVHRFSGNREEIKYRVSQAALNLLRVSLMEN